MCPAADDIWVIRPDAYIAAVVDANDPETVLGALRVAVANNYRPKLKSLSSTLSRADISRLTCMDDCPDGKMVWD